MTDRRRPHPSLSAALAGAGLLLACFAARADEPAPVPADKAKDHLDKKVTVEMTVRASKFSDRSATTFLNSEKDYKSEKNFTVVIFKDGLERFKEAKIDDPAKHFLDKKVRVTGTIKKGRNGPEMKLVDPEDIVVQDASAKPGGKPKPAGKPAVTSPERPDDDR